MVFKRIALLLIGVLTAIVPHPLESHGFSADTLLWASGDWKSIQDVAEEIVLQAVNHSTPSYAIAQGIDIPRELFQERVQQSWVAITGAARSVFPRFMCITLGNRLNETILCTPLQEFYVPEVHRWISAIDLDPGYKLLNSYGGRCTILKVELVREPLEVYAISVDTPHTYFVSIRQVLTHNIFLPAIECTAVIPWDLVFTGGKVALELGPATCGISIALAAGAGIGYAIYRLTQGSAEIDTYGITLDTEALNTYFGKKSRKSLGSNTKSSSEKGSKGNGNSGGGGGAPRDPKDPKKRNTDKVGNMYELFARTGFGAALKQIAEPTKRDFQGAKIFRAMSDLIEYGIKKGDQFYLDMFHKDHVEVFNKLGEMPRTVLRLNGSVDYANLAKAIKDGRSV